MRLSNQCRSYFRLFFYLGCSDEALISSSPHPDTELLYPFPLLPTRTRNCSIHSLFFLNILPNLYYSPVTAATPYPHLAPAQTPKKPKMPQQQHPPHPRHHPSWKLEGGAQVIDLETAVKDGFLGAAASGGGPLSGPAADKLDLKNMVDELDTAGSGDDVPAVFICPISLEPMLDPVTLCTGQTYERANIQRWFAMGHQTCPTTMQELWDDAVTPNRTLHQLIHTWFAQRYMLVKKRSEDVQSRAVDILESLRKVKGQARVQALRELGKVVAANASARKAVADCSGGLALISSLLGPFTSHAVGSEVVGILVNLPLDQESKSNLMQPAKISLVVDILNEGTAETKINCTRFVQMLMEEDDFRAEMVSSMSLLVGLVRLAKDVKRNPNGVSAGLGLLKTICSRHSQVRSMVVSIGAVQQLVELLPSLCPDFLDLALHVLDDLSQVQEGKDALRNCPQAIPNLVRLLMRISEPCTHHAMSILWAVCKMAPEECAPAAVEAGLAAKLLLVIQSGCSAPLKQRAAELLKLCSLNYTSSHFISKCKLTRTFQ